MTPKRIMVMAAHPDDEVLGCGGTIAKHVQEGDTVNVVIMAEGLTSREKKRNRVAWETELSQITEAAHKANEKLGVNSLTLKDLPDNRLDSLDRLDLIKIVESFIQLFKPDIVYTHHAGDLNIDHRRIHEAVVTACRPIPKHTVQTLLFFEIPSSTEWQIPVAAPSFAPNWYVRVTDTLSLKLDALKAYDGELRPWPHPRSIKAIEHLAHWRGSSVGVDAAEAFILGRNLVKG